MAERGNRQAGERGRAPRRRAAGGRTGGAKTIPPAGPPPLPGGPTWALDVHLTAPGRGKGDATHRIRQVEPFEVRGLVFATANGEPVSVDLVIEELRAQILIPEEALPRLRKELGPEGRRRPGERPTAETAPLKPERVQ